MDPECCPLMGGKSTILMASEYGDILHQASKFGDEEETERILGSSPFLVHEINMKGDTPLHIAARSGNLGVAKHLITCAKTKEVESGMNTLRMRNTKNLTVLQEAVRNDHYEVVDLLIKEDPGLTFTTDDGVESPLFMAVEGRFYQIAHRILETYPNCALSGRRGMTIMHAAVLGLPNYSLSRAIWNSCLPFFKGIEGLSLQFMVEVLETIGPGILQTKDELGWIPLHYAAYIGNEEVVKLFLNNDSSLACILNKQGMSALHISAQEGHIGVIKILMQKFPIVCEKLDNKGQTALHVAATNENLYVLRTFLRMTGFADLINEPDKEGNTMLHVAAQHSDFSILMMLAKDRRINKTATNNLGLTAGDIVRSSEQLCRQKKVFSASELRVISNLFPTSLERRVSDETRDKFGQDDNAAGRARDTLITAYISRQYHTNESEQVNNAAPTVNLAVASINLTSSFAAYLSMPGGYDDESGMPILRERQSFRFFLANTALAFGLSASSVFIHFAWPIFSSLGSRYPLLLVTILTEGSIICTVLAFSGIAKAVLTGNEKTTPLPDILATSSFLIPTATFVIIFWCSTRMPMFEFWFLSIVEKFRRKEKK